MSDSPFRTAQLVNPTFLQKLFHKIPKQNAIIEFNNILAATPLLDISLTDVNNIERKYKTRLHRDFKRNMFEFYAAYLKYCLADNKLSTDELT